MVIFNEYEPLDFIVFNHEFSLLFSFPPPLLLFTNFEDSI
jgi:hypothetical protein